VHHEGPRAEVQAHRSGVINRLLPP
jgi:hypothetical protein